VLALAAVGRIWLRAGVSPGPWDNLLWAAMMLVAVVGYGHLGYRWIEKPLVDYFHRLRRQLRDVNRGAASA
jgi:exopolysaccharide production protein ExoZ